MPGAWVGAHDARLGKDVAEGKVLACLYLRRNDKTLSSAGGAASPSSTTAQCRRSCSIVLKKPIGRRSLPRETTSVARGSLAESVREGRTLREDEATPGAQWTSGLPQWTSELPKCASLRRIFGSEVHKQLLRVGGLRELQAGLCSHEMS
jgi:hypothetical protein